MTTQPTQEPTNREIMDKLCNIEKQIKTGSLQGAWLTFAAIGAGFIGAGIVANWPASLVGLAMVALGYCGVRFRWLTRRS